MIIGIDLGTTHCAIAYVDPEEGREAKVRDFPIPQLVRAGEVSAQKVLPSFAYLPSGTELPKDALKLPWDDGPKYVTGELARWQGAKVPGRLVSSAKSWLCHPGVDRAAPILPWGAPPEVEKLSPVDASALYLQHLAAAWREEHPALPLGEQEVVITVPASFDEAARALTVTAARKAGLHRFTLVEEPQAAFYDFTSRHRRNLAEVLGHSRLVLVVDVGGGTTDLTLVQVESSPEGPLLRRIAVGEHLLLGGDNMDATVARRLEEKFGRKLSPAQWTQAVQLARGAKETLLGENPPPKAGVSLIAEGSRLLGGALSAELTLDEAKAAVLDGFFPHTGLEEVPRRLSRMAIQELGLPYAQDPAVSRHLAAFLRLHAKAAFEALGEEPGKAGAVPRPDAILLNGGVFNSSAISSRLVEVISAWWPEKPAIPLLRHDSLELAVARGAAYYGLVRRGLGLKIGGGAARAYYVGLQRAEGSDTVPALCLIPRGFEEGTRIELKDRTFNLTVGRPVQFTLFSTTSDRVDKPGELVEVSEDFKPLPPIHTILQGESKGERPVHLEAGLTEIGTLELWCVSVGAGPTVRAEPGRSAPVPPAERWRLEFELRGTASHEGPVAITEAMPSRFTEATDLVGRIYGNKPLPMGPKDVKNLFRNLEKVLGPKERWRVPVLRELWSTLFAGASKRRRSPDHERMFFQLLGYSLRPGFGYPLDAWRAEQSFALFKDLVTAHHDKPVWIEFWIAWRRIAGGLDEAMQGSLWDYLEPHLARRIPPDAPKERTKPKGIQPEGLDEMVRTGASLEHLDPDAKVRLGEWIAAKLRAETPSGGPWAWALGRLGARVPLYGSIHRVVAPEHAERWLTLLLELGLARIDGATFAAAQLARLTGDRSRDLEDGLRARAASALREAKVPESFLRMVTEVMALDAADEARALGDTLPAGLTL